MKQRLRRLRQSPQVRDRVRETELRPSDLVMPYFVRPGRGVKKPGSPDGVFALDRSGLETYPSHKL